MRKLTGGAGCWHQAETAWDIAADLGVSSRQVRQWVDWAKRNFPPLEYDYAPSDRMMLRRRRMLETRNAGRSVDWVAKRWGVSSATADNDLRRARADAKAYAVVWGPPAEPLLDWLLELPLDAAGWARQELLSQAASAMGHPVDFRHLRWKLAHTEWRCDAYLYRVDDAQDAGRRFRLALLERHQVGNLTALELAAEYGTSVKQVKAWLTAARRLVGTRVKGLPRGLRPDYGKRRCALELRNRGCSDVVVAQALGLSRVLAGWCVRGRRKPCGRMYPLSLRWGRWRSHCATGCVNCLPIGQGLASRISLTWRRWRWATRCTRGA